MTDLIKRLRSQEAVDAKPHEIEQLTDEAADLIASLESRISQQSRTIASMCQQVADLERDAERYRWLRRRAVMIDASDETITTITLFKDEGPTGEFLDDQIDGEIAKEQK